MKIDMIKYNADGLVPAIVQDEASGTVLMLAYMNAEALRKTLATGVTWFYSRSRRSLWQKGETSGHVQTVKEMYYDCDADTILVKVNQTGAACHEGTFSCFSRRLDAETAQAETLVEPGKIYKEPLANVIYELYHVINDRKHNPKEGSYTNYLFEKGQDKILKKVGEEAAETIIGSKNNDKAEILYEMADLWYHCLVLLANHEIAPSELMAELQSRRK
ncbi:MULTISPECIES: bifunctional phosphoribosyl-AMP cyclohydrolase/phosphoribosyl-ATP diphosphatase HisIE [Sporomusa]|uniref:bifunctional phosphoribosyl-AMP cyclohydrolase/phosphoribosyl-ATP diphosphatase HisIE n=1 Tax=Sporomusa TaxID=2375 RepID=UPI00166C1BBF|nr:MULTISPECIES: bifunctional phosphoribosyl-AMP cyclohydrolase/phosphoribosyl-ATP diphosphatase HisIE [Sporomusa]HML35035.1 bifunctional phosphoribosyl-AMP cyclohydrolase/phosphoribosyl-ATP diphosphatase HisIE [Sporomusa sphaeroides]